MGQLNPVTLAVKTTTCSEHLRSHLTGFEGHGRRDFAAVCRPGQVVDLMGEGKGRRSTTPRVITPYGNNARRANPEHMRTYFLPSHDFHLEFLVEVLALLLIPLHLLFGLSHFLLQHVQQRALLYGGHDDDDGGGGGGYTHTLARVTNTQHTRGEGLNTSSVPPAHRQIHGRNAFRGKSRQNGQHADCSWNGTRTTNVHRTPTATRYGRHECARTRHTVNVMHGVIRSCPGYGDALRTGPATTDDACAHTH